MIKQFSKRTSDLVSAFEEDQGFSVLEIQELWQGVGKIEFYYTETIHDTPKVINKCIANNLSEGYYFYASEDYGEQMNFYFTELSEEEMLERMVAHANRHKGRFEDFLDLVETRKTVEETLKKDEGDNLLEALEKVSKVLS